MADKVETSDRSLLAAVVSSLSVSRMPGGITTGTGKIDVYWMTISGGSNGATPITNDGDPIVGALWRAAS
jgi:hypothetical protein